MPFVGVSEARPTGSREISPEGLVLAYDMQTSARGTALRDFSGNRNDGRTVGTKIVHGPFGLARQFRTADDYIRLPSRRSLHLQGPLSIATWVNFSRLGQHQHIVSYDDLYTLWITGENRFRFTDTRGDAFESVAGVATTGEWTSLVATFGGRPGTVLDGGNIAVYVNGRRVSGRAIGAWCPGRPVEGFVGKESHGGQFHLPFLGEIAALLILRRELSAREAQAFADAPVLRQRTDVSGAIAEPSAAGARVGSGGERTPRTQVTPRIVRITNLLPPYRLRQHELLRDCPLTLFETWLMTARERNRRWATPSDPTVRVFTDWGLDMSHRGMFTAHFNPAMARELSRRPPALVLLGGYEQPTCAWVALLMDRMKVPFLVNSESISLQDSVLGRWAPFLIRQVVRRSAGVIVAGRATREHFLSLGVSEDRIFVAPPSVDVDRFAPLGSPEEKRKIREHLGIPDATVCLYVGQLVEWKGLTELLDAFRMLRPGNGGLHLQIVGDGPLRGAIETRVAGDPILRGAVSLAGYVPEDALPGFYQAADIFVFPTHRDVWGLVLNEAMSAGLAVISSDGASAALDLIEDGVNGFVVPKEEPRELADAMLRLHQDPALRQRMGRAARERILSGFTPKHQAAGILRAVMTTLQRLGRVERDGGGWEETWYRET